MQIRDLEYIIVLSETKNFTKAADLLHMTQPALTLAVKRFEKRLGAALFIRKSKSIALTRLGEMVVIEGRKLLRMRDEILRKAVDISELGHDKINIGVTASYGRTFLPKICSKFHESYPQAEMHFFVGSSGELEDMLLHNNLDAAIYVQLHQNSKLKTDILYSERMVLAMHGDNPNNKYGFLNEETQLPFICLPDLGRTPFLGYSIDRPYLYYSMMSICRENEFEPNIIFETAQSSLIRSLISADIGVGLIPWNSFLESNTITGHIQVNAYNVFGASSQRTYVYAYRCDTYTPRIVLRFLEICKDVHRHILEESKEMRFYAKSKYIDWHDFQKRRR